jgi:hypothetical protein
MGCAGRDTRQAMGFAGGDTRHYNFAVHFFRELRLVVGSFGGRA